MISVVVFLGHVYNEKQQEDKEQLWSGFSRPRRAICSAGGQPSAFQTTNMFIFSSFTLCRHINIVNEFTSHDFCFRGHEQKIVL
jgi:hypothetical protein